MFSSVGALQRRKRTDRHNDLRVASVRIQVSDHDIVHKSCCCICGLSRRDVPKKLVGGPLFYTEKGKRSKLLISSITVLSRLCHGSFTARHKFGTDLCQLVANITRVDKEVRKHLHLFWCVVHGRAFPSFSCSRPKTLAAAHQGLYGSMYSTLIGTNTPRRTRPYAGWSGCGVGGEEAPQGST